VNRLFINLYLDEDVSSLLGKLLRSRGMAALTTHDAGCLGASDAQQLAFASGKQMAILTHNRRDFESLAKEYFDSGRKHAGIVIAVRRPPYEILRRLLPLMNRVSAEEMDNQTFYI